MTDTAIALLEEMANGDWHVSGCLVCPYSEHSPRPRTTCPNDGLPLLRLSGRVGSWGRLERAQRLVRTVMEFVRGEANHG